MCGRIKQQVYGWLHESARGNASPIRFPVAAGGFRRRPFSAMNLGGREKLEKFIDFGEFLPVNEEH